MFVFFYHTYCLLYHTYLPCHTCIPSFAYPSLFTGVICRITGLGGCFVPVPLCVCVCVAVRVSVCVRVFSRIRVRMNVCTFSLACMKAVKIYITKAALSSSQTLSFVASSLASWRDRAPTHLAPNQPGIILSVLYLYVLCRPWSSRPVILIHIYPQNPHVLYPTPP